MAEAGLVPGAYGREGAEALWPRVSSPAPLQIWCVKSRLYRFVVVGLGHTLGTTRLYHTVSRI